MRKLLLVSVAAIAAVLSGSGLYADDYPSRPVTFTSVFGPGSASDTICRIIADPLGAALKQPVIVEDRPGADGAVPRRVHRSPAASPLARAEPTRGIFVLRISIDAEKNADHTRGN